MTLGLSLTLFLPILLPAFLPLTSAGGKRGKHPPLWKLYSPFEYANLLQGALKNGFEMSSERLDQTDRPGTSTRCLQMVLKPLAVSSTSPYGCTGKAG